MVRCGAYGGKRGGTDTRGDAGKSEIMYAIVLDGNTANKQAMAVNSECEPPRGGRYTPSRGTATDTHPLLLQ